MSVDTKHDHVEKAGVEQSEVLVNTDLMKDAFDGENREHEMSTWLAIKTHPWACLWAFTMCFTIVRCFSSPHFGSPEYGKIIS
jgi:SP family general alpha glucoside:H+ symporter-like MFS transporter